MGEKGKEMDRVAAASTGSDFRARTVPRLKRVLNSNRAADSRKITFVARHVTTVTEK